MFLNPDDSFSTRSLILILITIFVIGYILGSFYNKSLAYGIAEILIPLIKKDYKNVGTNNVNVIDKISNTVYRISATGKQNANYINTTI